MPAAPITMPCRTVENFGSGPRRSRLWILPLALFAALLTMLSGCATLLPEGTETKPLPWSTYAEAFSAINRIEPYKTTRQALHEEKIDPGVNPSITILNYTDLLQRLTAVGAVTPGHLDAASLIA